MSAATVHAEVRPDVPAARGSDECRPPPHPPTSAAEMRASAVMRIMMFPSSCAAPLADYLNLPYFRLKRYPRIEAMICVRVQLVRTSTPIARA